MPALRELRERAFLSQEELAERSGISRSTISGLERGARKKPYPRTIRKLAKALRCKPQDIKITPTKSTTKR